MQGKLPHLNYKATYFEEPVLTVMLMPVFLCPVYRDAHISYISLEDGISLDTSSCTKVLYPGGSSGRTLYRTEKSYQISNVSFSTKCLLISVMFNSY